MRRSCLAALFIWLLVAAAPAHSAPIVDTGDPVANHYYGIADFYYYAGQFSTTQAYRVTSVEAYLGSIPGYPPAGGTFMFTLFANDNGLPGTLLFSRAVSLGDDTPIGWHGPSGLDWLLPAGTYWLSVIPGETPGQMYMRTGAPNPLHETAYAYSHWTDDPSSTGHGYRIDAEPAGAPIPEPATLLLVGLGLAVSRRVFNRAR